MGPTPQACAELLRPLRVLVGLKQVALQRSHFGDELPYAAASLLTELVQRGECRSADLARHRVVDASVVSRQAAQLEQAGLVSRRPDPEDKRVSLLRATRAGKQAVTEIERRKAEWLGQMLADWDDTKIRDLARLLGEAMDDAHRYLVEHGIPDPGTVKGTR